MSVRRLSTLSCLLVMLFAVLICRVYWVGTDMAYAANAGAQTQRETELPTVRGNFLDRNGHLLTGYTERWYALCIPGDVSYASLFPYVPYREQSALYERRLAASPFLVEVAQDLNRQGIVTCRSAYRCLPVPIAVHLLGYLNGEEHGVSGLEKAYDEVLTAAGGRAMVRCSTTAQGRLVAGQEPQIVEQTPATRQNVKLTLDAQIQRACEGIAAMTMKRGCIVVLETASGEVLASVSMPEYDPDDISKSIRANDTSLINRPLQAFSVGSVFKVAVAAAAYDAGLDWYSCECTGSVEIDGQTYRCAKSKAHGLVNLRGALEQSCNCYFIKLGQLLGGKRVRETAERFGFGTACAVAPELKSAAGTLPDEEGLNRSGPLAVFSFGQGEFTATPLQIAAMTNAVADGGMWRTPVFVKGITDSAGVVTDPFQAEEPHSVCGETVARVLRNMLCTVVEQGIGEKAEPDEGGAGGKTGTAQTGQFDAEGNEMLNYWFTGFFPAEEPRYTVTVLQDGILDPETSSAEIFAQVANALNAMKNS